jgi:selenocysteine-specific elongation factor
MRVSEARSLGIEIGEDLSPTEGSVGRHGEWLVSRSMWSNWRDALADALRRRAAEDPLDPNLTLEAARAAAGLPDRTLVHEVVAAAGGEVRAGRVGLVGVAPSLGERAEAGLRAIEARLAADPFAAPEARDLEIAGLGPREVAVAARLGRILRLQADVLLLPKAPALAMRSLAALPQPFTTSDARQALGSTRRVVIPLLEHLDARGWTRRLDGSHREVRR